MLATFQPEVPGNVGQNQERLEVQTPLSVTDPGEGTMHGTASRLDTEGTTP